MNAGSNKDSVLVTKKKGSKNRKRVANYPQRIPVGSASDGVISRLNIKDKVNNSSNSKVNGKIEA